MSSATAVTEAPLVRAVLRWQAATVAERVVETASAATLVLDVPDWTGHRAGQHVDVRLTAEDGYQAQRSYSIASAPEDARLTLTVQRLADGEVSPYLVDEAMLREVAFEPRELPRSFVCGPTSFVEEVADLLVSLGHEPALVKTERFGPSGGGA